MRLVSYLIFLIQKAKIVNVFFPFLSSLLSFPFPSLLPWKKKKPHRKEGGKFGFAESIANQRITAFKMEKAPIDTSDVEEKAEEIISEAEPPLEVYLYWVFFFSDNEEIHNILGIVKAL